MDFNFVRITHVNGETWVASFYNGTPFPRVGETIDDTDHAPPRVLRITDIRYLLRRPDAHKIGFNSWEVFVEDFSPEDASNG